MAIKKFLDCISNYNQKISSKENRFIYDTPSPENGKPAAPEATKEPKNMTREEFNKYLEDQKTGIEIGKKPGKKDRKDRIIFEVKGIPRSFILKADFEQKLKDLKDPKEIKKAVYAELLRIVKGKEKFIAKKLRREFAESIAKGVTEEKFIEKFEASNKEMEEFGQTVLPAGPQAPAAPQAPDESGLSEADRKAQQEALDRAKTATPGGRTEAAAKGPEVKQFEEANTPEQNKTKQEQIDKIDKIISEEEARYNNESDTEQKTKIEKNIARLRKALEKLREGFFVTPEGEGEVFAKSKEAPTARVGAPMTAETAPVVPVAPAAPVVAKKATPAPAPAPTAEKAKETISPKQAAEMAITATAEGKTAEATGIAATTEADTATAEGEKAAYEEILIIKDGKKFSGKFIAGIGRLEETTAGGEKIIKTGRFQPNTDKLLVGTITKNGKTTLKGKFDTETQKLTEGTYKDSDMKISKTGKYENEQITAGNYTEENTNNSFTGTFENGKPSKYTVTRPDGKYEVVTERNAEGALTKRTGRFTGTDGQVLEGSWDAMFQAIGTPTLITSAKAPTAETAQTAPTENPDEPEVPKKFSAKYKETLQKRAETEAKYKATLALAQATIEKAKTTLQTYPEIDTIINSAELTADNSIKNLKGKQYKNSKTYTEIGKRKGTYLAEGRTIYDDGMIEEGKYNKGFLTEGRRISNNGMIEEGKWNKGRMTEGRTISDNGMIQVGKWNKGMMTEGRMISTDGKIYDGEYHTTGYLKKGTKTSPDGSKETAEWDEKNVKITQAAESAKPAEQQTPPAPPIVGPDAEPEIPPAPPIVGADAESAKPATTAETAPVAPVAPASAPSAPETRPSTRTTERFKADEKARMDKKATYIRDWEKISEENRNVSKTVSSLGENGIESNWKYIKGSGKVDKILKLQPFNISKHDTGRFIAKTITEWSNKEITLEDIFNIAAKHNPNFPRDYDKFMAEFKDLSNKNSAKENAEWARKFNEIVYPTIELLNAISKLNYNEKATKEAKEKREKENQSKEKVLSPEQKRIRENLYTMFTYSEREPGNWERLMGFFGGVKDEIPVMTDVNGETKYLDRGVLRRSYDPKAGYEIFMETIGTGEVDENDNRQIDADKMTDEVNRLMRLGGISIALQKLMLQEKKSIDELKKDPKFKEKLQKFHVPKLGSIQNFVQIPKDYMEAFQLGFILSQDMKSDKELEETKTMLESTENKEQSPVYKMMKDLEKQGLSQDVVAKIQDKLLAMGAVTFKDGKWEAAGLALNQPIQIGKGTTITVGISKIGKELKEGWNAGAALTVTVYEGENVKAGVSLEFDMNPLNKTFGFGFGANASFEDVLSTKLSFMGGVRAGRSGINVGFAALITRRNVGLRIAENKTEIEKETGLSSPEWEAFKASKGQSPKQRYELLKKATKIYDTIVVPLEATFGAEKEDVVYLIDNLENAIENKAVDKIGGDTALSIFAEFFHGVGAVVTPFPPMLMPVLVFKIGSAKIYIPNRSAISTMQEQISDVRANWKLKEALKSAEKKMEEGKPIATENQEAQGTTQTFKVGETPNLSYSPDGSARIIKKHQTFAFEENLRELDEPALGEEEGKAPKTSAEKLKALNDRLRKETGIMLVEDEKDSIDTDGRHELRILNTTNKDVEVYVDPRLSLKEAGLLVENGKLYLTGDISNLVIDRRNFTMPSGSQQSASYMKDIIIIGTQDLAAKEGLERDWIEKYSTQYAQKLKNQFGYSLEEGYGESAQANIKEGKLEEKEALALGAEAGERALKEATAEKEQVTRVKTHKENLVAKGERAKEAKAMDASAARRHESINSIEKKVYDAQKLPENFEEDIKELSKNKKFKDELKNISNDDEKIRDLILKFAGEKDKNGLPKYKGLQNLNEKALNLAIVSVLNEWFLALVKTGKESNSTIHKVLEGRMRFARKVFEKEFKTRIEEANKRLPEGEKISLTAEQAANKIMESIYNKIKDPNFPFKGLAWKVGEGVEGIPTDATLFSATRNKSLKGAFTKTMAYGKDTDTWAKMTLEHGFIKESVKEFNINSADKGEKDMARLLLEIASPSPKDKIETVADAKEFLQSPLAMKLSALEALMLIPEFGREKFDKVSELYKDISKENFATLFAKADYKEALDAYKKIAQDVRKAQTEGKPYTKEFDWGSDKYILTLSMTTAIKAGAYAKCANGSFYVKEEGTVTVQKIQKPIVTEKKVQEREPVTVFTQTTETIKSKQSKVLLTAALAGLNRETEQTTEQPPVHNKKAEQGAATATVTNKDRAGNANNGQIAQSKTTYDIPNENEGSVTSH